MYIVVVRNAIYSGLTGKPQLMQLENLQFRHLGHNRRDGTDVKLVVPQENLAKPTVLYEITELLPRDGTYDTREC
jgi:hypothetical protein